MQVENLPQCNVKSKKRLTFEDEEWPGDLKDDIKAIIRNEGFIKYDIKLYKLPVDGGNYMAELYEIDIAGKTVDGKKELNLFAKHINTGAGNLKNLIDLPGIYKVEKFVYTELRQVFDELQEDAKVPIEEHYKMVKCYESNPKAILMENLSKQGYKMYSRLDVVPLEYAELAIKNLAKFHALSFVIEKLHPDFFNSKIKTRKCQMNFGEEWSKCQRSTFCVAINSLDDDLRRRVEKTILNKLSKYQDYFENSEISCLAHGDYRVMNMMMKELDGKIIDLMPLDYQIIYYGNPLMDFVYFIFTATDRKFRQSHLNYLKQEYYNTLNQFLKYFHIDVEEVFPWQTFERMYEDTLDYGLIIMASLGAIIFADDTDIPDLANDCMTTLDFKVHHVYKNLLRGIVEEFIEWGHL